MTQGKIIVGGHLFLILFIIALLPMAKGQIFAVGSLAGDGHFREWDGVSWTDLGSLLPANNQGLSAVGYSNPGEVWMIGSSTGGQPQILSYDGTTIQDRTPVGIFNEVMLDLHVTNEDQVWFLDGNGNIGVWNGIQIADIGNVAGALSIHEANGTVFLGRTTDLAWFESTSDPSELTTIPTPGNTHNDIWGPDQDFIWISDHSLTLNTIARCSKTDDSCTTITVANRVGTIGGFGRDFAITGQAAGSGDIWVWDGTTWTECAKVLGVDWIGSFGVSPTEAYISGENGRLFKWDGASCTNISTGTVRWNDIAGRTLAVEETTAATLPEFETGLIAFATGLGFVTSESQLFFALILIGFAVITGAALLQLVSSGRFKNNFLLGTAMLIGIVTGIIFSVPLWMTLLAVILGAFTVQGAREGANTFRDLRSSIQASRAARAAASAEPAPPTESPLAPAPAAPAQETPEPAPAPEAPEAPPVTASEEEAS